MKAYVVYSPKLGILDGFKSFGDAHEAAMDENLILSDASRFDCYYNVVELDLSKSSEGLPIDA